MKNAIIAILVFLTSTISLGCDWKVQIGKTIIDIPDSRYTWYVPSQYTGALNCSIEANEDATADFRLVKCANRITDRMHNGWGVEARSDQQTVVTVYKGNHELEPLIFYCEKWTEENHKENRGFE